MFVTNFIMWKTNVSSDSSRLKLNLLETFSDSFRNPLSSRLSRLRSHTKYLEIWLWKSMLYYSVLPCKITRWKALITHAQWVCEYIDCVGGGVAALLYCPGWISLLRASARLGWAAPWHPWPGLCPIFIWWDVVIQCTLHWEHIARHVYNRWWVATTTHIIYIIPGRNHSTLWQNYKLIIYFKRFDCIINIFPIITFSFTTMQCYMTHPLQMKNIGNLRF